MVLNSSILNGRGEAAVHGRVVGEVVTYNALSARGQAANQRSCFRVIGKHNSNISKNEANKDKSSK